MRSGRTRVRAEAHQLWEALGVEETETANDASTLLKISQATRAVRAALLREALSSEPAANKLRLHEQGLSVALSRLSYSDAVALYREAILPALKADPGPKALRQCFALLSRWSLTEQVSPRDAGEIASRLTSQLSSVSEEAQETATLDQYAGAIVELAPRVAPEIAAKLAGRLLARATAERDPAVLHPQIRSLVALAPLLTVEARGKYASALVSRLLTERDSSALLALASALAPLTATLDPKAAGELAQKLSGRIMAEFDNDTLFALDSAFAAVAAKADAEAVSRISAKLLRHVELEPDPSILLMETQPLAAFGKKLPAGVYEEAAASILKRIEAKPSASTLSVLAYCLGAFKDRAKGDRFFSDAASEIVSRFATERDTGGLSALASAIDSVADLLDAAEAERLSSLLVNRLFEERNPGSLLYIAVGLTSTADEARGPGTAALVGRLTDRMREEHSAHVLRSLAFSAGAFTGVEANVDAGADVLLRRMDEENDPEQLRDLTSGLYALRNKADVRWFEKAASILASRIETQLDPGKLLPLIASLHALEAKASPEPFERAASAIVANANNLAPLEPGLQRIASELRPEKAEELARVIQARMAREQDARMLRVLGRTLADLRVDTSKMDIRRALAIPQAPCQLSQSPGELLNPLCSENSWNELAFTVVHAEANPPKEDLEADFTQLAPDDDDAATDSSGGTWKLDFRQLSDAVNEFRVADPETAGIGTVHWPGLVMLILGGLVLFYSLRYSTSGG